MKQESNQSKVERLDLKTLQDSHWQQAVVCGYSSASQRIEVNELHLIKI